MVRGVVVRHHRPSVHHHWNAEVAVVGRFREPHLVKPAAPPVIPLACAMGCGASNVAVDQDHGRGATAADLSPRSDGGEDLKPLPNPTPAAAVSTKSTRKNVF